MDCSKRNLPKKKVICLICLAATSEFGPARRYQGVSYILAIYIFELGMRRYTGAVAFGRVAQIRIPFLNYTTYSELELALVGHSPTWI